MPGTRHHRAAAADATAASSGGPATRGCTKIEGYRLGMEAVRRGAPGAYFVGANHPVWASVGLLEASRLSGAAAKPAESKRALKKSKTAHKSRAIITARWYGNRALDPPKVRGKRIYRACLARSGRSWWRPRACLVNVLFIGIRMLSSECIVYWNLHAVW